MGFMIGKSSAEPSLKLHLLRLEMQPWPVAPRRIISDLALQLQSEDNVLSMIYCIGSRCCRVAVLGRKVSDAIGPEKTTFFPKRRKLLLGVKTTLLNLQCNN